MDEVSLADRVSRVETMAGCNAQRHPPLVAGWQQQVLGFEARAHGKGHRNFSILFAKPTSLPKRPCEQRTPLELEAILMLVG